VNKKNIIVICSIAILALAITLAYVITRSPASTVVYVHPQAIVSAPGQNFTVDIKVSDASDLYAWEFKLSWNSTLLDYLNVTEGPFLRIEGQTLFTPVNITVDYMFLDCALLGNVTGVDGNGTLATIQFHVRDRGDCSLHLYDVVFDDPFEQSTVPGVTEGYFSTT
jgi:hypothetical protein